MGIKQRLWAIGIIVAIRGSTNVAVTADHVDYPILGSYSIRLGRRKPASAPAPEDSSWSATHWR